MRRRFFRTALILGLISAIGPFAIDMYLPALPSIGKSMGASLHSVQLSLMSFILAMSLTQLFYGPLSDIVGRKLPLYFGISLFGIASVGCALAPSVGVLVALRALQGIGAGAGVVIPRAVVRDLHTGPDAVRLMSMLMLVFSVSPILAPVTGSLVVLLAGWRGIFWTVAATAALGLLLAASQLEETRPPSERLQSSWSSALAAYGRLLADRHFIGLTLIGAFGMSGFFIYLANSSFVIINHYGMSPTLYSFFFASNAAAFIGTAQFNHSLTSRFGLPAVIRVAVSCFALTLLSLLVVALLGVDRLAVMSIFLFVGYCFLGLVVPNVTVLSLEHHGPIAGTASALLGTLQMSIATGVMGLAGIFANGTPLPMIGGIALCALAAFGLARTILGSPAARAAERGPPPQPPSA
jgi:DHA1 family bicyclomycin/chloramphenicol resistance-like MFS transporter